MTSERKDVADKPAIEALQLGRTFPGTPPTAALRDATFSVGPGEFVAIVGRSGSGKSTLLNILGLLDEPTAGSLLISGQDTSEMSIRQRDRTRSHRLGFVFQESHVLADQDALSNVALGLRCQRIRLHERAERAAQALDQVGLSHRARTLGKHLSGGERQRLAIARALATRPAILLADEPTGSLDTGNAERVMTILRDAASAGVAVVVITHDPMMAAAADRRITITDGRTEPATAIATPKPAPEPTSGRTQRSLGPLDDWADALNALTAQGVRTALLVLAFALGIATLVGTSGVSSSAAQQVGQRLNEVSLDEVIVNLNQESRPLLEDPDARTAHIDAISDLPGVESVGQEFVANPLTARLSRLPTDNPIDRNDIGIVGVDAAYVHQTQAQFEPSHAGASFSASNDRIVLLGADVAAALEIERAGPGVQVWLWGQPFDVIGIITQPGRDPLLPTSVVVPMSQVPPASVHTGRYHVRTTPGWPPPVAQAIPLALDPVNPAKYTTVSALDLRLLREDINTDLATLVTGLSAILLGLAAISASSTMLLSIRSRAPEIALRRALGSSQLTIAHIFLCEGIVVGLAGGALGAGLGLVATVVLAAHNGWTAVLDPSLLPLAVALGAGTGLVAAIVPAIAAARRNPAEAIRG